MKHLYVIKESLGLSLKASIPITIIRLVITIANSFVALVNLIALREIINSIIKKEYKIVVFCFLIIAIVQIYGAISSKILNYVVQIHKDKISWVITSKIIKKVNQLDIAYFDTPEYYNNIVNVSRDLDSIPNLFWSLLNGFSIVAQIVISFVILADFSWWIPILLIIVCVPNFVFDKYFSRKLYLWNRENVNEVRKMNYSYQTLTSKYFSKDVRINGLYDYLKSRYETLWNRCYSEKHQLLKKQFWASFVSMILPNIVTLIVAYLVIISIINGYSEVGDFSYYIGIMGRLTSNTFSIITLIASLIENNMKMDYYYNFMSWKSLANTNMENVAINDVQSIEFINVSFKYPGTEKYVLKNISFRINKGEKIGIVGENGAGKSTIIKLLLKLYLPTQGQILINGNNIENVSMDLLYKQISVMLQDYVNYSFSMADNLHTMNIKKEFDIKMAQQAIVDSNAVSFVSSWKNGLETFLTKSFDINGEELSTGQWQKIALARFFYKKANLLILDEPSAALDTASEDIVLESVFRESKGKIMILISHRYSNMTKMDKIICLEHGSILKIGSHGELIDQCDTYKKHYNAQKNKYL